VRCALPSVAMGFHMIGRDPVPARAESKSGRGESKDHPRRNNVSARVDEGSPQENEKVPTGRVMPAWGKTTLRRRGAGYRRPRCLPEGAQRSPGAICDFPYPDACL
jgi:hypothetical protein